MNSWRILGIIYCLICVPHLLIFYVILIIYIITCWYICIVSLCWFFSCSGFSSLNSGLFIFSLSVVVVVFFSVSLSICCDYSLVFYLKEINILFPLLSLFSLILRDQVTVCCLRRRLLICEADPSPYLFYMPPTFYTVTWAFWHRLGREFHSQ